MYESDSSSHPIIVARSGLLLYDLLADIDDLLYNRSGRAMYCSGEEGDIVAAAWLP